MSKRCDSPHSFRPLAPRDKMAGELFKMMAGVDLLDIPYRGAAPALTDLIGGRVQVMFEAVASLVEHVRGGKLRALAVASATRSQVFPEVPTVGEFLPRQRGQRLVRRRRAYPRHPPTSSIGSTRRSTRASKIPHRTRGSANSVAQPSPATRRSSKNSSSATPRNGGRSLGLPTSRRTNLNRFCQVHPLLIQPDGLPVSGSPGGLLLLN